MIVVRLIGGLGNQLFQYALGRNLAIKNNTELKLDISGFEEYKLHQYGLCHFNIAEVIATEFDIQNFKPAKGQLHSWLSGTISKHVLPGHRQKWIVEQGFTYNPNIFKMNGDAYLDGYWQSEKYFIDIAEIIRKEFTVKEGPGGLNQEMLRIIRDTHSVSLHIRRGDYVSDKKTMETHGVLGTDYCTRALDLIKEKITEPYIFVFSDDIHWAKENLATDVPLYFIDHNGPEKNYEDLRLMSNCQHNIIANSSFSWWAAWLNANPEKIVISPQKWFNHSKNETRDLIPDLWLKI